MDSAKLKKYVDELYGLRCRRVNDEVTEAGSGHRTLRLNWSAAAHSDPELKELRDLAHSINAAIQMHYAQRISDLEGLIRGEANA